MKSPLFIIFKSDYFLFLVTKVKLHFVVFGDHGAWFLRANVSTPDCTSYNKGNQPITDLRSNCDTGVDVNTFKVKWNSRRMWKNPLRKPIIMYFLKKF